MTQYHLTFRSPRQAWPAEWFRRAAVVAGAVVVLLGTAVGVASASAAAAGQVSIYTAPGINFPYGITAGPGGVLWFVNYFGNSIGRITTKIISARSFAGY